MKVCNKEAMKIIKNLENEKEMLVASEMRNSKVSYLEGEEKIVDGYDYDEIRLKLAEIDARVRQIKHKLAVANTQTMLEEFDMTIGEGLVYLAQLNDEYSRIQNLASARQLFRTVTRSGALEYTECLYSVERANADCAALGDKIGKLQLAIDRANLTTCIEI